MRIHTSSTYSCHLRAARRLLVAVIALALVSTAGVSFAGGAQHYGHGSEDFVSGILPPPGFYYLNYLSLTSKERLKDSHGDKVPTEFDADVFVNLSRFVWSSPVTFLDGRVNWGAQILIPWYQTDVDVGGEPIGGSGAVEFDDAGVGDIIFTPVILGWHLSPNFHFVTALDFVAPTGNWEEDNPATQLLSKNHWTFEPVFAVTYLLGDFDFSSKFMYDIHTENPTTNVKPGQEFHFDWAIGYAASDAVTVGINGFQNWQTTDDEVDGDKVEGDKSALHGIGPAIKWWPGKGRYSFTIKHLVEYGAKSLPEGQTTLFKFICAL